MKKLRPQKGQIRNEKKLKIQKKKEIKHKIDNFRTKMQNGKSRGLEPKTCNSNKQLIPYSHCHYAGANT